MSDCPWSRIDIIGQNGNDGLHYSEISMNINDVNKSWKENHPEPQWTDEESSQYTVGLMKKFHEELKRKEALNALVKEAQEMGLYN
jgi:hypothetical protein